jgi:hypothetical protein
MLQAVNIGEKWRETANECIGGKINKGTDK